MINEDTLKYQKMAILSLFSENTGKHLENIENEIKGIIRDCVMDYMKSDRGRKIVREFMADYMSGNTEDGAKAQETKSTRVNIE